VTTELWPALMGGFPPHEVPFVQREPREGPRRLAAVLAYDGGGFNGWQLQKTGPTLQGELEAALGRLCDQSIRVEASGRTDAGVHALGQVASFGTTSRLSLERMQRGLAALLPPGLHLRALGPVPAGFHARFDCRQKTYLYYLWPRAAAPLFLENRLWPLRHGLDLAAMRRSLDCMTGEVDLRALATRLPAEERDTVRRVLEARLAAQDGLVCLSITATGFLRHVVRNLVGVLVQVGRGRLEPSALGEMLAAGRRLHAGPKAPAGGLYLARVGY